MRRASRAARGRSRSRKPPARRGKPAAKKVRRPAARARRLAAPWLKAQEEKLERLRDALRREIEEEARLLKVTGTSHPREDVDMAEEEREDDEVAQTVAVLQERFRAVEEGLARLRRGTYGLCQDCQKPIPQKRLDALPSAIRCAPCQTAFERSGG